MATTTCTLSSKLLFSDLCRRLEKISNISRDKRVEYLKRYIVWFKDYTKKVQQSDPSITDDGFYPILRMLLPQLDRERSAYGIKEHTLAKVYIRLLCLAKDGQDASKLLNFRAPRVAGKQAGDFADVAFWVLRSRCPHGGNLSVHDVNAHLDNIALKHAAHDPRGVDAELMTMLRAMSAEEQKWLIRIILRDMKLGLGQSGIFSAFHPDARELYDVSNNLSKVCEQLGDPSLRLHEIEVSLFSPFRAMLAERKDVQVLGSLLKKRAYFYVETKYDGERFQLHASDGNFQYFSKNAFEYTATYGSSVHSGLLTPHLAKLLRSDVHSCILDGEMMAWHTKLECYRSKGFGFDVKSLKLGDTYRPCYCVFDILYLNGQVLSNKSLEERCNLLDTLFTPSEGILAITKRTKVTTQNEVIEELNLAIDNRLEGVMLKDPTSVYKPNSRKGGWFKLKPEYTDGLMDHLDLLIIGGYHGEGKRRGIISHFLVGVAAMPEGKPEDGEPGRPKEFHSVCRVGSGYSMTELAELLEKLTPHWQRVRPGVCPPGVQWTKEKPDVWVDPQKSYVLEIKASEVCYSNAFRTGCTLRFPRVENIRYDKSWFECTTVAQLATLRGGAGGKLASRHVGEAGEVSEQRRRPRQMPRAPAALGEHFRAIDLSEVVATSQLLEGKEFCVLSGSREATKQEIETAIARHGGTSVQNLRPATFCAVAGEETPLRVRTAVASGLYDVTRVEWLYRVLSAGVIAPWTPRDLIGRSQRTEQRFAQEYDAYGDSYATPATRESLVYSLGQAKSVEGDKTIDLKDMADLDVELFSGPSPYGIFRLCFGYFDEDANTLLDIPAIDFGFYGGKITKEISDNTTHIIVHSKFITQDKLATLQDLNRQRQSKYHIVMESWINTSIFERKKVQEKMYCASL